MLKISRQRKTNLLVYGFSDIAKATDQAFWVCGLESVFPQVSCSERVKRKHVLIGICSSDYIRAGIGDGMSLLQNVG